MQPMPQAVKIGPHVYTVLVKPAAQMPMTQNGREQGRCRFNELEIWLKRGMKRSVTQETLWHEVKHALTYPDMIDRSFTDEQWIEPTAPRELQAMQDNPDLIAYLTDK